MKNVFSIIWKVIAVAMICVGVYLLIQVMGDADNVIEAYEQMTGNSVGATNSIKIIFLRDYVKHTGRSDILVTLGVSPAEANLILDEDLQPDEEAEPEDDRQNPEADPDDNNGNGGNKGGGGGGSGGGGTSNGKFMKQSDPEIAYLKGGSSKSTMSNAGCGIVALYNAYVANTNNPISMKDMMLEYSKKMLGGAVKVDGNGNLQGKIGDLAEGGVLWNWMVSNYYNPGKVNNPGGTKKVNDAITSDGQYIVYFNHSDSGQHWVYGVKSGSTWTVQNPSRKEGSNIGSLVIRKWYKL